jgi:2-methylcitrate dehydratase PrpD
LPGAQTANALGIAAAQASGIREVYGTDTKAMQPGKAAMDGILCALFAEAGVTSSESALEGRRGLLSAIASAPDPDQLVAELGSRWHVLYNGHKLYPSASLNHPAVDAAIELHRTADFDVNDIEAIEVRMLPFAASVTDVIHPSPGAGAKFSTAHCVAVALAAGQLGLDDFGAKRVGQSAITRLRERTKVLGDPAIGKRAVSLTIQLRDGRELHEDIQNNRGTPENPLTDQELETKLYEVASGRYPDSAIAKVINCCWDLNFLDDVTEVLAPLRIALERVA